MPHAQDAQLNADNTNEKPGTLEYMTKNAKKYLATLILTEVKKMSIIKMQTVT